MPKNMFCNLNEHQLLICIKDLEIRDKKLPKSISTVFIEEDNKYEHINRLYQVFYILFKYIPYVHEKLVFNEFIEKYQLPVVITILSTDVIETSNPLYFGKVGLIGDRHGNFTLQNCDLLISLGCRMAQGIIGYRSDLFARDAKIVYIDNDDVDVDKTGSGDSHAVFL